MFRTLLVILMFPLLLALVGCGEKGTTAAGTVTVTERGEGGSDGGGASVSADATSAESSSSNSKDEVVVAASGYTPRRGLDYLGGVGLVLKNLSTKDALDVEVAIDLVDGKGTILESSSRFINVIPAGETYFFDGDTMPEKGKIADVETTVDVGSFEDAAYQLPPMTDVRVVVGDYGEMTVDGQIENPYDKSLSSFARISCVLWEKGKIVGGAFTYPDTELKPGRKMLFHASIYTVPSATRAKCSMDNEVV